MDDAQQIVEPNLDVIGQIVNKHLDTSSEAFGRYHNADRKFLTMAFWENHFEWKFLASRYSPCTVLDYGCGTGHSDIYLARAGFFVMGFEPNWTNFKVAEYIVGIQDAAIQDRILITNTSPEISPDIVNLVWMSHVLEHIRVQAWRDLFSLIVENKQRTLISVPWGYAFDVPSHVNHWGHERDLAADLESAGLTIAWIETDMGNNVIRAEVRGRSE